MNTLKKQDRVRVIAALVEGNSIRSTVRMTGVSKKAVTKLLVDMGNVCADLQDGLFRRLNLKRLQLDEIWSFVGCKQRNISEERMSEKGIGDAWVWTAIDAETKLIPWWHVGKRDANDARIFIDNLADRLLGIPQITTDGLRIYISAIHESFGEMVDYAMLIKLYGASETGAEARYSPSNIIGCKSARIFGEPDMRHVSTSFAERQNLSMRMGMRRFTRLTNGFSKKLANHEAAVSLYFAHYNLCRIHQTLRVTPAMAAGVVDHVWEIEELVALLEVEESK